MQNVYFSLSMATQEGKVCLIERQIDVVFMQAHTVCSKTQLRPELREAVKPKNNLLPF